MTERTTSELIDTLGTDIDRCHSELIASMDAGQVQADGSIHADYEYHARQLIRAVFAFIEAVIFSVKVKAAEHCLNHNLDISDGERFCSMDIEHMLTDKGTVIERPAHIRLPDNIRFAFALQEKAWNVAPFNPSCEWWSCLKMSIKVRDRLTHPKWPEDIDVTPDEIVTLLTAFNGFKEQVMKGGKQLRKAQKKTPAGKNKTSRPKGK